MKALIVEPSRVYQKMLGALFSAHPFETVFFSTGETGLEQLAHSSFDLACISLHLDDMSGIDFCKALRLKIGNTLPLIMITSNEESGLIEEVMLSGVTEIFRKSDLEGIGNYLNTFVEQMESDQRLRGHVLYVEDSLSVAESTKYELTLMGLTVDHVASGEEALTQFKEKEYDLIMTDILLAGHMSGLSLVREVRRSKGQKSQIPILAVSGLTDTARRVELLRNGANDFIPKPTVTEELIARVKNLITNKQLLDQVAIQQKQLQMLAMTDQLTKLYNRHFLVDQAPKRLIEAKRHQIPLSLLLIDLDHFKAINDTYGHDVGDTVLSAVAAVIREGGRKENIAARFGGEEFVLILPHCSGVNGVKFANRIRLKIEALNPRDIPITASFGVSEHPLNVACTFDTLFHAADEAVYEAKEAGRNCVIFKAVE